MRLIPIILCGGAGTRLWPISRKSCPKPFLRLSDGQSLVQKAFLRGSDLPGVQGVVVVTSQDSFLMAADEFRAVNPRGLTISYICEPVGRGTAAAIATAVAHVAEVYGSDSAVVVLAADHLVADQPAFADAAEKAILLAKQEQLVTFGIRPDAPEVGYGYIEVAGSKVRSFVEKPSSEKAVEFLKSGRFLWNSGMLCFTASTMLREMQRHCPGILAAATKCLGESSVSGGISWTQISLESQSFGAVPMDSIDCAVMEKCDCAAVVACDIGWRDVGSWTAMSDLCEPDSRGNRVEGDALLHDVDNCYLRSQDRVIGAVGVEDLIVVDTPDALLIANRDRSQDVRRIYELLEAGGHEAHRQHRTVYRPWGTYTVLVDQAGFKVKRIEVKPGASLSLQMHHHRSEHWVVVSGTAKVLNGDRELLVSTNESTYIPVGQRHRLENPGILDLVLIEVQSGQYLGEDDIVRFDDVYGRA